MAAVKSGIPGVWPIASAPKCIPNADLVLHSVPAQNSLGETKTYMSYSKSHSQEGMEMGFEPRSISRTRTCSRSFEISHLLVPSMTLSLVLRAQLMANMTLI